MYIAVDTKIVSEQIELRILPTCIKDLSSKPFATTVYEKKIITLLKLF
jgi:hypothetical protein